MVSLGGRPVPSPPLKLGVQSLEFNGTFNTMDDNNHLQELTTPTFSYVFGEVLCAR